MNTSRRNGFAAVLANRSFVLVLWSIIGVAGWLGLIGIGAQLLAATPPRAGFDLELLLVAGRRVASGLGPYDPGVVTAGLQAEALFYSYPPPIGQVLSIVAGIPSAPLLAAWGAGAVAGLATITVFLGRRLGRPDAVGDRPGALDVVIPVLALVPYVYPFAVALLFGNVDAWFPFLYGTILLGTIGMTGTSRRRLGPIGAGVALALVSAVKVHPGSLLAWFAIRGFVARRPPGVPEDADAGPPARRLPRAWVTLVSAAGIGVAILGVSLVTYGGAAWADWLALVRAGTGADIVTWLNVGPGSQVALLVGGNEDVARLLALPIAAAAVLATAFVAWRVREPVESLAWATTASLITLPVTWFHYPVALLPFAIAAWIRSRRSSAARQTAFLLALALVLSGIAIVLPVSVWLAVGLVLLAVHRSWTGEPGVADPSEVEQGERWRRSSPAPVEALFSRSFSPADPTARPGTPGATIRSGRRG